ncbi:uncharacterized protein LOC144663310 [Oculina patagonica]
MERQILEAKYELEQAALQVKILEEDHSVIDGAKPKMSKQTGSSFGEFGSQRDGESKVKDVGVETKTKDDLKRVPYDNDVICSRLNPHAREFTYAPPIPDNELSQTDSVDSEFAIVEDVLDKLGSTIRQGFALPKPDLSTFDGNPMEYWSFIRSFENTIERNATSESEKLMYLLQYTTGEAKKTIDCCVVMDPSRGYQSARKLLKERFGHPYTIAAKFVSEITEGPPIKASDRSGLLAFADQLKNCEHTLESIGYIDEVNSADNLRRIVQRLPFHLRTKFVEVADGIQQSGKRPNIKDISSFVAVKARAANNPVFGGVMDVTPDSKRGTLKQRPPSSKTSEPSPNRITTLNTQGTVNSRVKTRVCPACSGNHILMKCQNFGRKTFDERVQIMRRAHLCHNCFQYGHIARGCLSRDTAGSPSYSSYPETTGSPNYSSYPDITGFPRIQATQATVPTPTQGAQGGQLNSTQAGSGKVCLRIVPVKVQCQNSNEKLLTYALLDNGSDVSLCTKGLAARLGVQGEQKTFYLTTQEKEDSPKSGQEISLTVEALDGSDKLEIQRLWTVDKVNASSNSIPTNQDISSWPHLQDINLLSIEETNIELIIGCNVPEAFWVLEERRGNKGDPYAIRSPLGWTLMGPIDIMECKKGHHCVNFTRIANVEKEDILMQQLERFWKTDYAGLIPDCKVSMSVEDKRALAVMESSAKLVDGRYQLALP